MVKISEQRKKQREISGSPEFQINVPAISDGETWIASLSNLTPEGGTSGQMKKWLPFNEYTIRNSSNNDIQFYRNQNNRFLRTISGNQVAEVTGKALRSIKIIATCGAINDGEITINVNRSGANADELSKHVALNPLIGKLLGF